MSTKKGSITLHR